MFIKNVNLISTKTFELGQNASDIFLPFTTLRWFILKF